MISTDDMMVFRAVMKSGYSNQQIATFTHKMIEGG
jgi:hypothetical protein